MLSFKTEANGFIVNNKWFQFEPLSDEAIKLFLTSALLDAMPEMEPELGRVIESLRAEYTAGSKASMAWSPPLSGRVGDRIRHRAPSMVGRQEYSKRHTRTTALEEGLPETGIRPAEVRV